MPAESVESRQVIDDIDLFRKQLSYDDDDQPQLVPTASTQSTEASQYASKYGYRSRNEVADAILKLRGKEKQAEYIRAQGATFQHNARSVVKISEEAREPAEIADVVTQSHSSLVGSVLEMAHSNHPSQNSSALEPDDQAISDHPQKHSLHTINAAKKTKKTEGLFGSLFRLAFCATETNKLPDFSAVEEVKDYSVEGIANDVQELKIETASQFLSPPHPLSANIQDAPRDVVHHPDSFGGCSTMTNSVAGKEVRDDSATTKRSTLSDCAPSLADRDCDAASYDRDEQMASKNPSVREESSSSFTIDVGKGSLMEISELGTRSSLQSFSLQDQGGDTFSSASCGSSEEDSDYTLSDGSSLASCSIDYRCGLTPYVPSYESTLLDDGSMSYGTSFSGSSFESY